MPIIQGALGDQTDGPYAVNHHEPFIEDVFADIVRAAPPVVSFALGCRADLIARAHDTGGQLPYRTDGVLVPRPSRSGSDSGRPGTS